jgi:superfamily II DNA/RNA helicase
MKYTFETLNIKPEIIKSLAEMGIKEPTQIQEKAIPLIMDGKDLVGISKTGSGKTAAFGIPILNKVTHNAGIHTLIMAPTRELAVQIAQEMRKFGKYVKFSITTIYGGVSINPQMTELRKADVVVGTPGRLLDHVRRGTINLKNVKCLVLDEADKMVEMGFIEDIRQIMDCTPSSRQTLLFGATISEEINALKGGYMHSPEYAKTETHVGQDLLKQYYYNIQSRDKFSLLLHLIKNEQVGQAIIFCSARSTVELVYHNLHTYGIKCGMLHGKMSQNKRLEQIKKFNEGTPSILVASPIAARGLDIKDITHIFNYDLSKDPQEYIHRIGRTARAGESGKAITLLSERDYDAFNSILQRYPVSVQKVDAGDFQRVMFQARSRYPQQRGRFNGPRDNNDRFGSGRSFGVNFGNRNGGRRFDSPFSRR